MKRFTKNVLLSVAALGLVGGLSACGSSSNSSSADSGSSGDKEEIEFFFQKQEMLDTMKEIVADFEAENPDITVKLTNVPDGATVLKTRMASGDVPDVVHVYPHQQDFQTWAESGTFADLTDTDLLDNVKDGVAETYAIDGKDYAVPLSNNAYGIFYNATAFEELGIEAPTTFAEFEEDVQAIKDAGETPFAEALSSDAAGFMIGFDQLAFATTTGGYDEANAFLLDSPKDSIEVSDPVIEEVLSKLDIVRDNYQANAAGAGYNDSIASFASGDGLMLINGTWALPAIQALEPDFEIRMFAFPGDEAGQELTAGAADLALAVSETSEHKEASEKFVKFVSSAEEMQKYYDVDGGPVLVDGVDTEGKFPETEGVTELVGTDNQIVWLAKDWSSETDFGLLTVDYILNGDADQFVSSLNTFVDTMK
ncbi:extracellular solute-binding protein [Enterococcus sp. HY326]|uniref:extracellular solute-binding protein n=1 Tax=Enterococcus sp. HY326 TaxID=2971265 RepID=UPI0022406AAD|nr:extracellular solute-binding protein [Enterococcus sp. HY326]